MANGTSTIQLPPGYEDAVPVGSSPAAKSPVQLPSGYEDAKPVAAAAPAQSTPKPFNETLERSLIGANDFVQGVTVLPKELVAPPQNPTEALLHFVSPGGLPLYRLARNIISAAERVKMAGPADYQQTVADYNKAVQQFKAHDWRNAIPSAVEAGSGALSAVNPVLALGNQNVRELAEGSRPGGNLAGPLTKDVLTAGLVVAPEFAEGGAFAPAASAAAPAAPAATSLRVNPFRAAVSGEKAVQPAAQRIMAEGAQAAAADSGVPAASVAGGLRTYLDEPIANVAARERVTYDTLNKAAKVDMKNLYEREAELEDAIDDPTNIVAKPKLNVELQRTRMQIANGESAAQNSGIDAQKILKTAKADTQQRYALEDLKKKVFNNENIVSGNRAAQQPESINIDKAISEVEKMDKPSKFAPSGSPSRLEQALGKDGAAKFKTDLYAAQKAGQKAASIHTVSKWIGGILGTGLLGAGAYEAGHQLVGAALGE